MRTITVTGTGRVSAAPDNIFIGITVTAQSAEYEKTVNTAAERLDALRSALAGSGFGKDDLKTVSFSVNTEYQHEHLPDGKYERRFVGYTCTHQLRLEFGLDMERLSSVIADISGCRCAPEFSIQFGVKDEDALRSAMLRSAADDALASAKVLAEASGVTLGPLVSVDYSLNAGALRSPTNVAMPLMAARASGKAMMDFAPEDIEASERVTFIWEIK